MTTLRKEEKKTQERCQKRKDEEAEAQHAQGMLESINKKKQIAKEVEAEYGIKSKKALLNIKEEQDQGQECFEDEGSFYLINAHGRVSSAGGSRASGAHAPHIFSPTASFGCPTKANIQGHQNCTFKDCTSSFENGFGKEGDYFFHKYSNIHLTSIVSMEHSPLWISPCP